MPHPPAPPMPMRPSLPSTSGRSALALGLCLACVAGVACRTTPPAVAPSPPAAPGGPVAAGDGTLRAFVDSLVAAPEWRNAHWGILIVDPARGDTLYSRNAGKLFMPASNQKIITGALALARLGPDYRFRTEFAAVTPSGTAAPIVGGELRGDLLVTGYGDPTFSDHAAGDAMAPLRAIADSLRARGIARIAGTLRPGAATLPGPALGYGWAWDDLDYAYSAGVAELYFNEGFARLVVRGGARAGDSARVDVLPSRAYPSVRASVQTSAPGTRASIDAGWSDDGRDVTVIGTVPAGDSAVATVAQWAPRRAFLAALHEALAERGIAVVGAPWDDERRVTPPAARWVDAEVAPLLTWTSPPLREILPLLEKPSQNQIAELFFRTLGREATGVGTPDSARAVVERALVAWGAERDGFAVRDGSGLSRHDYVSPETLVRVLARARQDTAFAVFRDALPIAGVDGTIASRMKGTAAQGNVHAKTGYIDRARSLSGYVTTADGVPLIFSFLANNWTTQTRDVERVQDAIAARLASMTLRAPGGS